MLHFLKGVTGRQAGRQASRQAGRHTNRWVDGRTDGQTDRQTDRTRTHIEEEGHGRPAKSRCLKGGWPGVATNPAALSSLRTLAYTVMMTYMLRDQQDHQQRAGRNAIFSEAGCIHLCAVLCCAVLCCAALCYAVLRCAALCCAVLCCAVLCSPF